MLKHLSAKSKIKKYFFYLFFLFFSTTAFYISCWEEPEPSRMVYSLDTITIDHSFYTCWNPVDTAKTVEKKLQKIVEAISEKDLRCSRQSAIQKLKEMPIWICYLPEYINYEYCSKQPKVGCYDHITSIIWLTEDALIHELIHHVIRVILSGPADLDLSGKHQHPIQLKYELKLIEDTK